MPATAAVWSILDNWLCLSARLHCLPNDLALTLSPATAPAFHPAIAAIDSTVAVRRSSANNTAAQGNGGFIYSRGGALDVIDTNVTEASGLLGGASVGVRVCARARVCITQVVTRTR